MTMNITVDPPLPDGLTLNPRTGEISGIATREMQNVVYTFTARDDLGESKYTLSLGVGPEIGKAVKMLPCPFCEGPPCQITKWLNEGAGHQLQNMPAPLPSGDGIFVEAWVFCHECGADGPKFTELCCEIEGDVDAVELRAVEQWNQRDNRHRGMYDDGDARGLNEHPRSTDAGAKHA